MVAPGSVPGMATGVICGGGGGDRGQLLLMLLTMLPGSPLRLAPVMVHAPPFCDGNPVPGTTLPPSVAAKVMHCWSEMGVQRCCDGVETAALVVAIVCFCRSRILKLFFLTHARIGNDFFFLVSSVKKFTFCLFPRLNPASQAACPAE